MSSHHLITLAQQLEDVYRASRHSLQEKVQQLRLLEELTRYSEAREALCQHYLHAVFPEITCTVQTEIRDLTKDGGENSILGFNVHFIMALEFGEEVGWFTQLFVTESLKDYMAQVEQQPAFIVATDLADPLLLPERCSSLCLSLERREGVLPACRES